VYETDDSIGQLLKALADSGQADNTLVIFSADNGPEHYAYPRDAKYKHWSSYPLRGLKRDIYEGGHRVPFIVKWPGKVPAGKTSDALISQIDIMATVAGIVDYKLPVDQAEDSHDQLALITGKSETGARTAHIHNTFANKYAIRDGDWVLVNTASGYAKRSSKGGKLFNLKEDVGQKHNVIAKYPEKAEALRTLLKKLQDQGHSAPRLAK
jgi:arylsulfatase A